MAATGPAVMALSVPPSASDEGPVFVRDTAAVLTLRTMKHFCNASGSYNRDHRPGNVDGATRMDIFDVDTRAQFLVSNVGVWGIGTQVVEDPVLMLGPSLEDIFTGGNAGAQLPAHKKCASKLYPEPVLLQLYV